MFHTKQVLPSLKLTFMLLIFFLFISSFGPFVQLIGLINLEKVLATSTPQPSFCCFSPWGTLGLQDLGVDYQELSIEMLQLWKQFPRRFPWVAENGKKVLPEWLVYIIYRSEFYLCLLGKSAVLGKSTRCWLGLQNANCSQVCSLKKSCNELSCLKLSNWTTVHLSMLSYFLGTAIGRWLLPSTALSCHNLFFCWLTRCSTA